MKIITIALFALSVFSLQGQYLTGIGTKWSDSFTEWIIYTEDEAGEETEGELHLRWPLQNDWTEWEYRSGDNTGTIKLKWKNNPNEWELRGSNEIITIRTVWNNDFREWRITNNTQRLTLKSRYGNLAGEWELRGSDFGHFEMYTAWEGDPREWVIVDELNEVISLPMKMALVFIVVFHSSPKQ